MHVGAWINTVVLDSNVWELIKPKQVWALDYVTGIPLKQILCIVWEELIYFLGFLPISDCSVCGYLSTKWKETVLLALLFLSLQTSTQKKKFQHLTRQMQIKYYLFD